MNKFSKGMFTFLSVAVTIALFSLFVASAVIWRNVQMSPEQIRLPVCIGLGVLASGLLCFLKIKTKYKVFGILAVGFLLRLFWTLTVPSVPVSDFLTIYHAANGFLAGDVGALRGYGYLARFPHLIPMMVYMAGMIKLFGSYHIFAMKSVALILSVITVYEIYVLSGYYVKKEISRLIAMVIAAVYPSFITYSSTYCTETIGVPLFLLSVILFHHAVEAEKHRWLKFLICGGVLYCSNLFRGVALIFLIAFGIYLLLFGKQKKLGALATLVAGYFVVSVAISSLLLVTHVIEKPLWKGSEPGFATLMLKGHNFEHYGQWNAEDAQFVEENLQNEELDKLCFAKVKERLSERTFFEIAAFYASKFMIQWSVGDCSGMYWATMETGVPYVYPTARPFQGIYTVVLFLGLLGIFSREKHPPIGLMLLLLCGFGTIFMVLETQSRYAYVVNWVFIILAAYGVDQMKFHKSMSHTHDEITQDCEVAIS